MRATYANPQNTDVRLTLDDGTEVAAKPDDPRLTGLTIAPYPYAVPASWTDKTEFWRRCTADEAAELEGALDAAPAFLRQIFLSHPLMMHDAPEWPALVAAVTAVVGAERAAVILAPSGD